MAAVNPLCTSQIELAWAAGLFDGEGNIGKKTGTERIRLSVTQKERYVLDRFVIAVEEGKVGGPYGPYSTSAHYRIQLSGTKALKVIDRLWPYLSEPKKEQARSKGYIGY